MKVKFFFFQFDFGDCGLNITRVVVELLYGFLRNPIDFQLFQVIKPLMHHQCCDLLLKLPVLSKIQMVKACSIGELSHMQMKIWPSVVYFDQLLDAALPRSWSKYFLGAIFNLFCWFQMFFSEYSPKNSSLKHCFFRLFTFLGESSPKNNWHQQKRLTMATQFFFAFSN